MVKHQQQKLPMSEILKCYRSGNTLRVSILRRLRYKLNARAGDLLKVDESVDGVLTITNLSHSERLKMLGRIK